MKGIVYASTALIPFDTAALQALEAQSSKRNAELGITGYLYYDDGRFFQYIEGEPAVVTTLMDRIAKDPRHTVLYIIHDEQLRVRRFPSWSMRALQRPHFVGLEAVLNEHVVFMKRVSPAFAEDNSVIWSLVDELCAMRDHLAI